MRCGSICRRVSPPSPSSWPPAWGLRRTDGSGESFGVRRCALLADAIVRAHEAGVTRIDARVDAVVARFAEAGVEINAPYREPTLAGRHVL